MPGEGPLASDEEPEGYRQGFNMDSGIAQGLVDLAKQNEKDLNMRVDAVRKIGGLLSKLRKAMMAQREYDRNMNSNPEKGMEDPSTIYNTI